MGLLDNNPTVSTINSAATAPVSRSVNQATDTAQGQLNTLLDSNNPLMQRAYYQGVDYANGRGLLNSSVGAEVSQAAMMDAAIPIATSDAATYYDQGKTNQGFTNQFNLSDRQFEQGASENALDRSLTVSEAGLDRTHVSSENLLDREHATSENGLDRALTVSENGLDRELTVSENGLDRNFTGNESALNRMQESNESALDRNFTGNESALNRMQESNESALDRTYNSNESLLDRDFTASQNDINNNFNSSENALQREHEIASQTQGEANERQIEATKQDVGLFAQVIQGMSDINASDMEIGEKDAAAASLWTQYTAGSQIANSLRFVQVNADGTVTFSTPTNTSVDTTAPVTSTVDNTTAAIYGSGIYTSGFTRNSAGELVDSDGLVRPSSLHELTDGEWVAPSLYYNDGGK